MKGDELSSRNSEIKRKLLRGGSRPAAGGFPFLHIYTDFRRQIPDGREFQRSWATPLCENAG